MHECASKVPFVALVFLFIYTKSQIGEYSGRIPPPLIWKIFRLWKKRLFIQNIHCCNKPMLDAGCGMPGKSKTQANGTNGVNGLLVLIFTFFYSFFCRFHCIRLLTYSPTQQVRGTSTSRRSLATLFAYHVDNNQSVGLL